MNSRHDDQETTIVNEAFSILHKWGCSSADIERLLGKTPDIKDHDVINHARLIVSIDVSLNIIFSAQESIDNWVNKPNTLSPFDGATPFSFMIANGDDGLRAVSALLLARSAGVF